MTFIKVICVSNVRNYCAKSSYEENSECILYTYDSLGKNIIHVDPDIYYSA